MYALFALLSFAFVMRVVPETNGMSLEEANTLLPPKGSAKAKR
jgi:SP family sugar:H+ symporter-like MFS transporter